MDRAKAEFLRTRYFDSLDGLRALSIVAVIWHHAGNGAVRPGILGKGWLGVDLFFAISGFLITTLLLREKESTGSIGMGGFYWRRTLRIFPAYYLVLGIYLVLVVLLEHGPEREGFFRNLPWFLTYTFNYRADWHLGDSRVIFYFAWSLATEEQFYLCWPWVMRFARAWWSPLAIAGSAIVIHELAVFGVESWWWEKSNVLVRTGTNIAPAICLGCAGALLAHRPRGFRLLYTVLGQPWSAPAVALAIGIALTFHHGYGLLESALFAALVTSVCIRPVHRLRPLLANRIAAHLGAVSYGMYLFHMIAVGALARALQLPRGPLLFTLAVPVTVGIATLSHRYFEARFLALKNRWRSPVPVGPRVEITQS